MLTEKSNKFIIQGGKGTGRKYLLESHIQSLGESSKDILIYNSRFITVENAREIVERVNSNPLESKHLWLIFADIEYLSKLQGDTFLKIFEDCPKHLKIFATCFDIDLVQNTIKSRMHLQHHKSLSSEEFQQVIVSGKKFQHLQTTYSEFKSTVHSFTRLQNIQGYRFKEFLKVFFLDIQSYDSTFLSLKEFFNLIQKDGTYYPHEVLNDFLEWVFEYHELVLFRDAEWLSQFPEYEGIFHTIFSRFKDSILAHIQLSNPSQHIGLENQFNALILSLAASRRVLSSVSK